MIKNLIQNTEKRKDEIVQILHDFHLKREFHSLLRQLTQEARAYINLLYDQYRNFAGCAHFHITHLIHT